jgi:hypothetical protein
VITLTIHTDFPWGVTDGGSDLRPSEPQAGGWGSRNGQSEALKGTRMPRWGRIAVRLQYGPLGEHVKERQAGTPGVI